MANLETLTIEIGGSASKASGGIQELITSLSSLGSEISKQIGSIRELASSLKDIRSAATGGNIWKNLTPPNASQLQKSARVIKDTGKALVETKLAVGDKTGTFSGWKNAKLLTFDPKTGGYTKDVTAFANKAMAYKPGLGAAEALGYKEGKINTSATREITSEAFKNATTSVKEYDKAVKETASSTKEASKATKEYAESTKSVKEATSTATHASAKMRGLFSQIGRIAKTMLIRTAIRGLMKVAKQGLDNFYNYSKSIGSAYAATIDSMKVSATTGGNQIGAALGTLLAAIYPIVSTIISIVTAAAQAITALFALLGGGTTYSVATNGFNSIGSSAGGAGKKVKELLADFDELNVISQEAGGGGGGGGGGNFGGMFKEMELPRWLIEWQPVIKALLGGVLGAIVLPQIWNWIKKILDLFTGGGASRLYDILKYWKKNPFTDDDMPKFPTQPTYKPFPEQPKYTAFPEQPKYDAFPIQPTYTEFPKAPNFGKTATDMGIFAGAAVLAKPAVEGIVSALGKLKTAFSILDFVKSLGASLLGSALNNSKTKIEVDRTAFDDFKTEYEDWSKQNTAKMIHIGFSEPEMLAFNFTAKGIDEWADQNKTKLISVGFDNTLQVFNFTAKGIEEWVGNTATKLVSVGFDKSLTVFNFTARGISEWTSNEETKLIKLGFSNNFEFNAKKLFIDAWILAEDNKTVGIGFNEIALAAFNLASAGISTWAQTAETKAIQISMPNLLSFFSVASALESWAKKTLTKVINIAFHFSVGFSFDGGGKGNGGSSGGGSGGLGWDWKNGLTFDGKGVVDTIFNQTNQNIKNVLDETFNNNGLKWNNGKGVLYASGGFPDSGELFIARENGLNEFVGSMGNRSAVANNDQIVEGIRQGVADGQAEQNTLLRQQNEILRSILAKDNSVRFGASSAFGRTVRQSLDMYNSMVGG